MAISKKSYSEKYGELIKKYRSQNINSIYNAAKKKYNTYAEGLSSILSYDKDTINSALESSINRKNQYKENIVDYANRNNIEIATNRKNLEKAQLDYSNEELDSLYSNKYDAYRNIKAPLRITDVAENAQNKYSKNKQKFDEQIKYSDDYKNYTDYAYNAVPILEQAQRINEVNQEEVGFTDKLFTPVVSGAKNSLRNIFMPSSGDYRLANGNIVNLPSQSDIKAEKVLNSYDTGVGEFLGKTAYSIGQQLPSMAIGLATGGLGTVAGATSAVANTARTAASLSSMFANVSRNTTNQKLMEGYTKEQANQYGLMSGAIEVATETAFGGFAKLMGPGWADNFVTNRLTQNIQNRVLRNLADAGISSVGEGVEEVVSGLLQPIAQQIALDDPRKYSEILSDQNLFEDFLVGTISSLIMSAPSTVVSFTNNQSTTQTNNTQVNLPPATNLQESIVNDAVNARIEQNNINLPATNNNGNLTKIDNTITSKLRKISKWAIDKVGNLKPFRQQLNEYESNQLPSGVQLIVAQNNEGLEYANVTNNPIVMKQNYVDKLIKGKHSNIPREVIENIDTELKNSVLAMDSRTVDNSRVIVLDRQDLNGNPIIATLSLDKTTGAIVINELTSVYEKSDFQNFINHTVEDNKNIYTNEKTEQWLIRNGLQLPTRFTNNSVSTNNNSTNQTQSQIAPLPLNNMQNNPEILIDSDGQSIDISNLSETNYMKLYHYNRKYNKNTIRAYRGTSENTGNNGAFFGLGLYTTLDQNYAKQYGNVELVDTELLPDNPIKFKTQNDFHIWEQELAKELGTRKSKLYSDNYGVEQYILKLGYDGLMIGTGKDTDLISFKNVEPLYLQYQTNSKIQQEVKLPTQQDIQSMQNSNINLPPINRVLNPIEISQLTPEDANTTPILPNVQRNQINDGESRFYSNIRDKTNMLNEQQKKAIMSEEEVQYYDKVTNKDSLEKAFNRLNENGESETKNWFAKDSEKATAVDVAEGWILLKQYADNNQVDDMVAVAKKMRDIGTKAGQTVQAFNIMARMTPEGMVKYAQSELSEVYDRMVKGKTQKWIDKYQKDFDLTPQETGAIMEIMKKVSTMEDGYDKRVELAKIQKIMTDKLPPERGAGIKSWMRISMLFNAKTQVRNIAGNAIIAPVNAFSDLFASMADKVVGAKTGYRTTGVTNVKNYVKGFKEGAYQSYNDFRRGINTRNIQGNRFEISEGKSFNNNTPIGKALNRVDSLLSFMLDAGDRTFYEATFTNSINNQLVLNNTTEVTQEMIDIATQEALSRTWQDNNNYTRFVLNIRKGLNAIHIPGKEGYGLGDVLIPFAKTPANLTKAIVDYSPAGLVSTLIKGKNLSNAIKTGQFTPQMQHEFVQSLGKATAGTMLYIAGYALAKAGIITGESDDDKDVSNFMKNTLGVNSYSIKIGDMSFAYDWAQPVAAPFSMMANLVQKQEESDNLLENVTAVLDTGLNVIFEQSFLTSINDVLSEPGEIGSKIGEQLLDLPARAVPTFMKQIVDLTDDTQRTSFEYDKPIQSMINSIKAKIPGLSQTLAPSVDTMGREIQRYGGKNNIFNVFLNPANVSTENISESAEEIYRLYKETGKTDIMPRVAPYYINKDGEKITLDSNTRAEYQKASGQIIEDNVKKLLEMSEYNSLSDEKKADIINDIVNYSYSVAQNEVLDIELSDTYKKAYEYSKIGAISDYYTFQNNIDDTDSSTKRETIKNYLINSSLNDNQISYLYGNYYSSEETLNNLIEMRIPIKEFIKFDSQEFEGDYNTRTGKTISGSRKNKVIQYVNSLNLSIPQKAILIKMEYNSYGNYNNQIVNYINGLNKTANDKKVLLKSIGFDNFNKDVVEYINSQNISIAEKEEKLKDLGFTIRNGRVYW